MSYVCVDGVKLKDFITSYVGLFPSSVILYGKSILNSEDVSESVKRLYDKAEFRGSLQNVTLNPDRSMTLSYSNEEFTLPKSLSKKLMSYCGIGSFVLDAVFGNNTVVIDNVVYDSISTKLDVSWVLDAFISSYNVLCRGMLFYVVGTSVVDVKFISKNEFKATSFTDISDSTSEMLEDAIANVSAKLDQNLSEWEVLEYDDSPDKRYMITLVDNGDSSSDYSNVVRFSGRFGSYPTTEYGFLHKPTGDYSLSLVDAFTDSNSLVSVRNVEYSQSKIQKYFLTHFKSSWNTLHILEFVEELGMTSSIQELLQLYRNKVDITAYTYAQLDLYRRFLGDLAKHMIKGCETCTYCK